jgi:hypothetical protein
MVINLTHAPFAAWWTGRVPTPVRRGGFFNERAERLYDGASLRYLVACADGLRERSWLNLVDLYRATASSVIASAAAAGGANRGPASSRPHVAKAEAPSVPLDRPMVVLNPGANQSTRAWPAARFGELARVLHGDGFAAVVVGAASDASTCAAVAQSAGVPVVDLSGKTTIPELAALLERAALVVTNDTGTAHVAAAAGARVLGLYGDTAGFRQTAPWGAGHVVLQTPFGAPMHTIAVAGVVAAARSMLGRAPAAALVNVLSGTPVSAWETVMLDGADPLGGVAYVPRHRASFDRGDLLPLALRHVFARDFCESEGTLGMPHVAACAPAHASVADVEAVDGAEGHLRRLQEFAGSAQKWIARRDTSRLNGVVRELEAGLAALQAIAHASPGLAPVIANLDWALRFMPVLPPAETFRWAEAEYRRAASLLVGARSLLASAPFGAASRDPGLQLAPKPESPRAPAT